ncbi:hypothetical protein OIE50_27980 [Streptomyces canus]|uniref:hypothetical protein n=1 Tax=Streptomyces canus TaxID=58343 RepID=UPI00325088B2
MGWNPKHRTTVVKQRDGYRDTFSFRCSCGRVSRTVPNRGLAAKMANDHCTAGLRRS